MRSAVVLLQLLLAAACNAPAQREQVPSPHGDPVGPCTGIAVAGTRTYFCFQSGLQAMEADLAWSLPKLPFRPFAIAAHRAIR